MIELKCARTQLARLKVLPYPISDEAALKELEEALLTAEDEFHAGACITEFTQYADRWPTPADIRRLLASTSIRAPKRSPKCQYCLGAGFRTYAELVTRTTRGEESYTSRDRMPVPPGDDSYVARYMRSYQQLRAQLGPTQELYEFSEKCSCSAEMAVAS